MGETGGFDPEVWKLPFKLRIEVDAEDMEGIAALLDEISLGLWERRFPNRRVGGGATRSYIIEGECPNTPWPAPTATEDQS